MMNRGWKIGMNAWIWLKRFRHRCGYGVHSPFVFDYITNVIYENTPYYAYEELEKFLDNEAHRRGRHWKESVPRKVRKLFFRMVNRAQPQQLLYIGPYSPAIPYLLAAKNGMKVTRVTEEDSMVSVYGSAKGEETFVPTHFVVADVIHLSEWVEKGWPKVAQCITPQSVLIVKGVGEGRMQREAWQKLKDDPCTGISLDLYSWGILFFDHHRVKQHFVVNF